MFLSTICAIGRWGLIGGLICFGLLLPATVTWAGGLAAPLAGEVCFATPNTGVTVYSSTTAQAVRDAAAATTAGGTVKAAGYCAGAVT
jgi:hypothetical protein